VHNRCAAALDHRGVRWRPLPAGLPERADLYIANRGHRLIGLLPGARARAFWLHNPARYLLKTPLSVASLWRWRPDPGVRRALSCIDLSGLGAGRAGA